MGGASQLNIERVLDESIKGNGLRGDIPLLNGAARTGILNLTGATTPAVVAIDTTDDVIRWLFGDTAATVAAWSFWMPDDYARAAKSRQGVTDDIVVKAVARKVDSSTDENADLALQCQVSWYTPGTDTTVKTLTTPAKATLAASTTGSGVTGFAKYTLDIGERLRAESKTILPGDKVRLILGPDDTVGTTNMTMDVSAVKVTYRKHAALATVADR